ncbi:MAG: TetR/AcrR family transcriptional regulator [Pseudomonadota bacterium]
MARASLKAVRSEQILDAYERCVVQFGVEGAGLQKIADEAGMTRSLLRHNIGNSEDLLKALVERFLQRGIQAAGEFDRYLPQEGRIDALLELLFNPLYRSRTEDILLYQALLVAGQTRPGLRSELTQWYDDYVNWALAELSAAFPEQTAAKLRPTAVAIIALYFNCDSMATLTASDADTLFADGLAAARTLVGCL